jgi:NADH dehydrogenase
MKKTLFITGASGSLATSLLTSLDLSKYKEVYCLSRTTNKTLDRLAENHNIRCLTTSICQPINYASSLAKADIVVHFAATTGKAKPETYFKVNTEGTRLLINECKRFNVQRFLHISTIAVNYKNISQYFYALSKRAAEDAIRESGLNYIIIRPTIIIDQRSPILKAFLKLVRKRFCIIFGDGTARIQPIYVDDFTQFLTHILNTNNIKEKEIEIGGPEVITFEEFMEKIYTMKHSGRFVPFHIPLNPLVYTLRLVEKPLLRFIPFTAGQLSLFANDGLAKTGDCVNDIQDSFRNIDEMLQLSVG